MAKPKRLEADQQSKLMLAYLCVSTEIESSLARKVEILDRFDLTNTEIATVCGCTERSVQLSRKKTIMR